MTIIYQHFRKATFFKKAHSFSVNGKAQCKRCILEFTCKCALVLMLSALCISESVEISTLNFQTFIFIK